MERLKRIIILLLLLAPVLLFSSSGGDDCFTIIAGKDASDDGSVLLAHNEDDSGKNFFVNVHRISRGIHGGSQKVLLKNKAVLQQVKETFGFLWFEIAGVEFGDAYMNENGVVIASNQCKSREDRPVLTDGGIGFMLRRLIAERALTAGNAIEIAGQLIDKYGYYSSGRSYAVADSTEAWLLQVVNGKHWIAKRVPDSDAAVVANRYTIEKIDLADKKNYLGSPDIIDYAVKRGWYNPGKDGEFNFARAYSSPGNYTAEHNVLRQWRGTSLLAKKKYTPESPLPFSFKPRKKIKITDLFRVLRDHYEDTEYDLTRDYKDGSPNKTGKRTICTESTQYSFVAQLRRDLPREIANIAWIAFRRPDSNAYSPWYLSIAAPPESYTYGDSKTALENHFKRPESFYKYNPGYAFWTYARLSALVDQNYRTGIKIARKEWKNFENYNIKTLKKMEKEFKYLIEKNKNIAAKIISNYVQKLEYRKWFLASEIIGELEKKESK